MFDFPGRVPGGLNCHCSRADSPAWGGKCFQKVSIFMYVGLILEIGTIEMKVLKRSARILKTEPKCRGVGLGPRSYNDTRPSLKRRPIGACVTFSRGDGNICCARSAVSNSRRSLVKRKMA